MAEVTIDNTSAHEVIASLAKRLVECADWRNLRELATDGLRCITVRRNRGVFELTDSGIVAKAYRRSARRLFRDDASSAWKGANACADYGISVGRPVTHCKVSRRISIIAFEKVSGDHVSLAICRLWDRRPSTTEPMRRHLLRLVGEIAAQLHGARMWHNDLRLNNILVTGWDTMENAEPKLTLIDFDRAARCPKYPEIVFDYLCAYDLRRLLMSDNDVLTPVEQRRLLLAYFRSRGLTKARRNRLMRLIQFIGRGESPLKAL